MKITRIKLTNFASIFAGTGKKMIEIDFTHGVNPITLIVGKNGSGKTSLLSNLHPFPYVESIDVRNGQDLILPKENGRKEMTIVNGEDTYMIDIYYNVDSHDKRTTKCFIWKNNRPLNQTGLVRSYYDVLKVEFGIDPSFLRILRLGPNVADLVSMKASERKDYISTFLQDIDIYTKLYQTIKSESSYVKNQLKVITANYDSISSEAELKSDEKALQTEITNIEGLIADNRAIIAKAQYQIGQLPTDDAIENIITEYGKACEVISTYGKIVNADRWKGYDSVADAYTKISIEKQTTENRITTKSAELKMVSDQLSKVLDKITDYGNKLVLIDAQGSVENIDAAIKEYQSKMKDLIKPNKIIGSTETYKMIELMWQDVVNTIHDNMDVNVLAVMKREIQYLSDTKNNVLEQLSDIMERKMSSLSEQIANIKAKDQSSIIRGKVLYVPSDCKSSDICPYFKILDKLKVKTQEQSVDYLEAAFDVYMMTNNHITAYKGIRSTLNNINRLATEVQITFADLLVSILNFDSDAITAITNKIHELVGAASDNDLYQSYSDKIAELTKQRDAVGFDSAKFIREELDSLFVERKELLGKIKDLNSEIDGLTALKGDIANDWDAIEHDYRIYKMYIDNQAFYTNLIAKYKLAKESKTTLNDLRNQIHSTNINIGNLTKMLNDMNLQMKDIYYKLKSKQDLEKQMEVVQKRYETVELIKEALSSTKGIPLIFIQLYLKNIQILANSIIHEMFGDNISLLDFNITDKEFSMPYMINGLEIADVSYSSQGERTTIVLALSFALLQQFMGKYNILLLDEVDSALYKDNRRKFIKIVEDQMKRIGCEQAFMITHNALFENYPVNIIETSPMDGEFKNSCIIWPPAKVEYTPDGSWQTDYV